MQTLASSLRTAFAAAALLPASLLAQGALAPASAPAPTMHSLEQIYDRLAAIASDQQALAGEQRATTQLLVTTLGTVSASFSLRWATTTVASTNDIGEYCSLAFGPDGEPAIAAVDNTTNRLRFFRRNAGTWTGEDADTDSYTGRAACLVFDPEGRPTIAHLATAHDQLRLAVRYSGGWTREKAADTETSATNAISLAYDPNGRPAIAYQLIDGDALHDLYLARFDGNSWSSTAVDTGTRIAGAPCALDFGPDGQPGIAYYDSTFDSVRLATRNADGQWLRQATGTAGGTRLAFAFAPNGQPAIVFYNATSGTLYFIRYAGTSWTQTSIDTTLGSVPPSVSLRFGPDGQPAVAYYNASNQSLKFALFNGTLWNTVQLTSNLATPFVSLAFGPDGQPAVAYYDSTDDDLRLCQRVLPSE